MKRFVQFYLQFSALDMGLLLGRTRKSHARAGVLVNDRPMVRFSLCPRKSTYGGLTCDAEVTQPRSRPKSHPLKSVMPQTTQGPV